MLYSPTFLRPEFPGLDLGMVSFELVEGLTLLRKKLGQECYEALSAMSGRIRAHFAADPEGKTGDGVAGRKIIGEREEMLKTKRANL